MFKKVLVGVDGGDGGLDAIALARLLAAADAELTLANVYPSEPVAWRGASGAYEAVEREGASALLEEARKAAGVEAKLRWHPAPDVGRGLHEMAEEYASDLIVVGSSRKGRLGRVFHGDDTRHALNGAPCAVAIAPIGYRGAHPEFKKVGLGYNESPESEQALAAASELATEHGASLFAMEVIDMPARYIVGPAFPDKHAVADMLHQAMQRIEQHEGVTPEAVAGVPAEELGRFSETVDLMVIGSRNYGPIGRVVYGSTAHDLSRAARTPLLVLTRQAVRSGDTPAEAEPGVAHATQ